MKHFEHKPPPRLVWCAWQFKSSVKQSSQSRLKWRNPGSKWWSAIPIFKQLCLVSFPHSPRKPSQSVDTFFYGDTHKVVWWSTMSIEIDIHIYMKIRLYIHIYVHIPIQNCWTKQTHRLIDWNHHFAIKAQAIVYVFFGYRGIQTRIYMQYWWCINVYRLAAHICVIGTLIDFRWMLDINVVFCKAWAMKIYTASGFKK